VLSENEHIRVWEMLLAPGESCQPHRHLHDHRNPLLGAGDDPHPGREQAGYSARRGRCVSYRAVGPDGLPPHMITIVVDGPSRHFIVELLGPTDAPSSHEHNGRARMEVLA
jgi:hypothetical protein